MVINHHLLCADLSLWDEGCGEILPGADCFIIDEAHQLPDVASSFFGLTLSSRQLLDLTRDLELEYRREAGDIPELLERADDLRRGVLDLRLGLGEEARRRPWSELAVAPGSLQALDTLRTRLGDLHAALDALQGRGKRLDGCLARSAEFSRRLTLLAEGDDSEDIRWYETLGKGFRLHQTPLQVTDTFRSHRERYRATWIFTPATLAVGERFDHFAHQLGIDDARTERWESPFDYGRQALWFVPREMPDPATGTYGAAVVALAAQILAYSGGRAFLLFTSHRALREAAHELEARIPYPLLVQGSAPRAELLERFRRLGNAVLLGTASFWEGVDVRGEALSCVIIDKLPFASPGDPVLAARINALRRRGGNPFRELQLPQAVIALKQGTGRLIRDVRDRGVLVVCDPRLLSRSYGHAFLDSLSPMRRSRDLEEVQAFFAAEA